MRDRLRQGRCFAALVAPGVRNDGIISAELGSIGLSAVGSRFSLDLRGDNLISFAVSDEIAGDVRDVRTGKPLSALVDNKGTLKADGGRVALTAATARKSLITSSTQRASSKPTLFPPLRARLFWGRRHPARRQVEPQDKMSVFRERSSLRARSIRERWCGSDNGENLLLEAAQIDAFGGAGGGKNNDRGDYLAADGPKMRRLITKTP